MNEIRQVDAARRFEPTEHYASWRTACPVHHERDHEPRLAIDWAFDLDGWGLDQDDEPWVIYTRESTTPSGPLANSSA